MRVAPVRQSIQSSYSNDCGRGCRVSSLNEETANRENSKSAWLWLVGWQSDHQCLHTIPMQALFPTMSSIDGEGV